MVHIANPHGLVSLTLPLDHYTVAELEKVRHLYLASHQEPVTLELTVMSRFYTNRNGILYEALQKMIGDAGPLKVAFDRAVHLQSWQDGPILLTSTNEQFYRLYYQMVERIKRSTRYQKEVAERPYIFLAKSARPFEFSRFENGFSREPLVITLDRIDFIYRAVPERRAYTPAR